MIDIKMYPWRHLVWWAWSQRPSVEKWMRTVNGCEVQDAVEGCPNMQWLVWVTDSLIELATREELEARAWWSHGMQLLNERTRAEWRWKNEPAFGTGHYWDGYAEWLNTWLRDKMSWEFIEAIVEAAKVRGGEEAKMRL